MADYFTQFSCIFDVGSAANAERAVTIFKAFAAELDGQEGCEPGFDLELDPDHGPGALWIGSDGYGEPEHVIAFVLRCADTFDLSGRWGFVWALTCSRPRLDGFGGGGQLIDLGQRRSLAWLDCEHWLANALDPAADADADNGVAQPAVTDGVTVMATNSVRVDNASVAVVAPPTAA